MTQKAQTVQIGWCLGGGSARGYALFPIVRELVRLGAVPDAVAGCSAGAIIGAYYCLHGEVETLLEHVRQWRRRDFLRLVDMNNPRTSLIKGKKVYAFLYTLYGDATFEDLRTPLVVAATRLPDFAPVHLTTGRVVDAVMASISIPGIFPPYTIGQTYYVDGQVTQHVPYHALFETFSPERAIAVDLICGVSRAGLRTPDVSLRAIDVLFGSFYAMMQTAKIPQDIADRTFTIVPQWANAKISSATQFDKIDQHYAAGVRAIADCRDELCQYLQ